MTLDPTPCRCLTQLVCFSRCAAGVERAGCRRLGIESCWKVGGNPSTARDCCSGERSREASGCFHTNPFLGTFLDVQGVTFLDNSLDFKESDSRMTAWKVAVRDSVGHDDRAAPISRAVHRAPAGPAPRSLSHYIYIYIYMYIIKICSYIILYTYIYIWT